MAVTLKTETPERRGYSAVLYGPPLVGKTTTLALDPNFKVGLIDLDKNSTTVEESGNVTIFGCDDFSDYLAVKEGARAGSMKIGNQTVKMDFDLYAIDSFTTMEERIKRYVVDKFAPNRKREIASKFGAQTDWADLQDLEIAEVRDWQAMTKRASNPINVLWIGHDNLVLDSLTGQAVATELLLQGKYAAPRIISAVDAMFYMIKQPDTKVKGVVHRGIYTIDQGIVRADARIAIQRRSELKSSYWDSNIKWSEIFGAMGYKR